MCFSKYIPYNLPSWPHWNTLEATKILERNSEFFTSISFGSPGSCHALSAFNKMITNNYTIMFKSKLRNWAFDNPTSFELPVLVTAMVEMLNHLKHHLRLEKRQKMIWPRIGQTYWIEIQSLLQQQFSLPYIRKQVFQIFEKILVVVQMLVPLLDGLVWC